MKMVACEAPIRAFNSRMTPLVDVFVSRLELELGLEVELGLVRSLMSRQPKPWYLETLTRRTRVLRGTGDPSHRSLSLLTSDF